jgi:hypothetical protein
LIMDIDDTLFVESAWKTPHCGMVQIVPEARFSLYSVEPIRDNF